MSSMNTCPNCHVLALFETTAGGDTSCTECGFVMEESAIVAQVEFVETANGTSAVLGQYISSTSGKPYGGGFGMSRESREAAMENARRRLQQIAGQLNIPAHFVDAAHRLYILALDNNFTHGRRMQHVLAACLYIVCRRERSSHLLIDFAEKLRENVFLLGATYLKFVKLLSLQLPVIDPSLYIHRFAANLDLGDDAQQVANTALRIVARMKRDWIQTGRRPAGICGASLLIAARVHGYRRTRAEVQQVVRVTEGTIKNRLAEFQNTPASLLTPDEFETLELPSECDPPAYVRGLLEEEIVKEQALLEDALASDLTIPLTPSTETPATAVPLLMDAEGEDKSAETALTLALHPSSQVALSGVTSRTQAEALVTERLLQKLMNEPRLKALIDSNLLVSEQDVAAAAAEGFSKEELRLWKVRALLQKNWGRGRDDFLNRVKKVQEEKAAEALHADEETTNVQLSENLELLSKMVADHVDHSDDAFGGTGTPAFQSNADDVASQATSPTPVSGKKRKRSKVAAASQSDDGSAAAVTIFSGRVSQRLNSVYTSLANDYKGAGAPGLEDVSVNKLLYDRQTVRPGNAVRVEPKQHISTALANLANKDYDEVEAEVLTPAHQDEPLSDLDDSTAAAYLVPDDEAAIRHSIWDRLHGKFMEERKQKQQQQRGGAKSDVSASKSKKISASKSVATADEAAKTLIEARKLSKKVNYAMLNDVNTDHLFDAPNTHDNSNNDDEAAEEEHERVPSSKTSKSTRTAADKARPTKISRPVAAADTHQAAAYYGDEDEDLVAEMGYGGASGGAHHNDYEYYGEDD